MREYGSASRNPTLDKATTAELEVALVEARKREMEPRLRRLKDIGKEISLTKQKLASLREELSKLKLSAAECPLRSRHTDDLCTLCDSYD